MRTASITGRQALAGEAAAAAAEIAAVATAI
jgi:hypothetical protein